MSEREALADVIWETARRFNPSDPRYADAILASDWLRDHDAALVAQERERIAREIEHARNVHWQGHLRDHPYADATSCPGDYGKHDAYYHAARIARGVPTAEAEPDPPMDLDVTVGTLRLEDC